MTPEEAQATLVSLERDGLVAKELVHRDGRWQWLWSVTVKGTRAHDNDQFDLFQGGNDAA